jgi:hypothetical protein
MKGSVGQGKSTRRLPLSEKLHKVMHRRKSNYRWTKFAGGCVMESAIMNFPL